MENSPYCDGPRILVIYGRVSKGITVLKIWSRYSQTPFLNTCLSVIRFTLLISWTTYASPLSFNSKT